MASLVTQHAIENQNFTIKKWEEILEFSRLFMLDMAMIKFEAKIGKSNHNQH